MRLTTRGRFAVTAMVDLALHGHDSPVTLASISTRRKISSSYLEQLLGKLRRQELVISVRGPGGGFSLAKPAESISVADIVQAVDENLDTTQCHGHQDCCDQHCCITHDLWASLNAHIQAYLAGISLQDLVARERTKTPSCHCV